MRHRDEKRSRRATTGARARTSLLAAVLVAACSLVPSAMSAPSSKYYTVSVAPATAAAGGVATLTLTIANSELSTQTLGSANITIPGELEPLQVGTPVQSDGKVFTASLDVSARLIKLRNPGPSTKNALSPGQSVSVVLTAGVPCGSSGATGPFETVAKQSNDFKGKGNDFALTVASPTVEILPAALKSFGLSTIQDQKAGVQFAVVATAYDVCGAVKTDYAGSPGLSGLGTSPSGKAPEYGSFSWNSGIGSASVTAFKAETGVSLTVTDGSATGASNAFAVTAGDPASLSFTTQPSDTAKGQVISPGPTVAVADAWENPAPGVTVGVAIGLNPTGASLGGTVTSTTDSSGAATFGDLAIALASPDPYTLAASTGALTTTSAEFYVADVICVGGACSGSATSEGGTSVAVNASGTSTGDRLYIRFEGADLAANCGWSPDNVQGDGSEIILATSGQPSLTISWLLPAEIRKLYPNNGVAHYDVCLGGKRLDGGQGGFTTKDGSAAWQSLDGNYWGLLPDCRVVGPANPCIASRSSNDAGDLIIEISVPYPWDPHIWAG